MNPFVSILASAAAIVGVVGLSVLPPDSSFATPTVAQSDPFADLPPVTSPQRPLAAPQTRETIPDGYCPQVFDTAPLVGLTEPETVLLSRIAWLESRCINDALGDLDRGVSYGILQIHGPSWCEPNRWWPDGYLQAKGVLAECEDLFDPALAVLAATFIIQEGGFEQWSTYSTAVNG